MAAVAPFGACEAGESAALGARPIPWTPPRAPRASLSATAPPAATSAVFPCAAVVATALPLPLAPAMIAVTAQRLEQALLLGVLLAESLQYLMEFVVAANARPSIVRAAVASLPPPATAHG